MVQDPSLHPQKAAGSTLWSLYHSDVYATSPIRFLLSPQSGLNSCPFPPLFCPILSPFPGSHHLLLPSVPNSQGLPSAPLAVIPCPLSAQPQGSCSSQPPKPPLLDETETPWWLQETFLPGWCCCAAVLNLFLLFSPFHLIALLLPRAQAPLSPLISHHLPCSRITIASIGSRASPPAFPKCVPEGSKE